MEPFLKQVARHYSSSSGRLCFIFPNRRSMVFFTKYFCEQVAQSSDVPVAVPRMLTMNDFFFAAAGAVETDRVSLLLDLYDCYKELYPNPEPLDEFLFWGDILLSDFDDVDKYLVPADKLFTNVADYRKIQDSFDYITESQRKAMEKFMDNFNTPARTDGKLPVKDNFLKLWNIMYPLYVSFNESLSSRSLAYQGMVYRSLALRMEESPAADVLEEVFPGMDKFVFVGLNVLSTSERKVLKKMYEASLAEFCWDYPEGMIRDEANKSSLFMSRNVKDFPGVIDTPSQPLPRFRVVSVPSSTGQAKLLPGIFSELGVTDDPEALGSGRGCAVVLPDENLLLPVLNSIPPEIGDVNVTMGYSMRYSSVYALMKSVCALQMHIRFRDGEALFYHRQVKEIFSNGVFKTLAALPVEGEERPGQEIISSVISGGRFYISGRDLSGNRLFDTVFRAAVGSDLKVASAEVTRALGEYLSDILRCVGGLMSGQPSLGGEAEFARRCYNCVNLLSRKELDIKPQTYFRLLDQAVSLQSVPFKGEPLKGLQIMGPLETRSLDFDNVIILSCNEGVFPRRNVSSSFIPAELRKGFDLPTYEFQDAVWAYYFYRLVNRADNVVLVYDSRTEGTVSGEESRYIKQLEYCYKVPLEKYVALSPSKAKGVGEDIPKTAEHIALIKGKALSASRLNDYVRCPAFFYYSFVEGLKAPEDDSEDLDSSQLGTVFHKAMQELYSRPADGLVRAEYLESLAAGKEDLKGLVRRIISEEIQSDEVTGRDLVVEEVILRYITVVLTRDAQHLRRRGAEGFRIEGLERRVGMEYLGFRFTGVIDRLDSTVPGELRVVDYKTGKYEDKDIRTAGIKNKVAVQLYLYDLMLRASGLADGEVLVNSIYSPSLLSNTGVTNVVPDEKFCATMENDLDELLGEIADPSVPFARSGKAEDCKNCDFKNLCQRWGN